ncbi:alpha-amylase [Shewanella sp. GutCb]|uniref:alpha-amylase family protein n=1 Tax=Shewanella sp. GutCb TaxID=2058315 RepID=UPI000C7C27B1|nr:alpha-amylase family protein [Shewanella sp. GutCb]PKG73798.1 alpha-amylase [Shewanella sp. GutCb]
MTVNKFNHLFKPTLSRLAFGCKKREFGSKKSEALLISLLFPVFLLAGGCSEQEQKSIAVSANKHNEISFKQIAADTQNTVNNDLQKPVVYQVFTRLFGNKNTNNQPWGTITENGVGKFSDFDETALNSIKSLGTTHVWYTGVPHHALIGDYKQFGISDDDPDVVKGRAGSPYAVKDYYNVNPDLADNVENRFEEFKALIARTHAQDMKVIIDIVPNHVARAYQSPFAENGVTSFGAYDDTSVTYKRHNNFYYVVQTTAMGKSTPVAFKVPDLSPKNQPLVGESHPLADGKFKEFPAKWTGNGARAAQPDANDWYETVKINYGVKPDGSFDFPVLDGSMSSKDVNAHYQYWLAIETADLALAPKDKLIPDSWVKFKQITQFWLENGVDGFRYDMAEMVPVPFWSYLNSNIKHTNPDAFLLAEVYNPALYRDYIHLGKMDYLYDKVDMYDTLKGIIQGKESTAAIAVKQAQVTDIEANMLHFLENHDEQRIASPDFAGDAFAALPAMVVSTTISSAPTLIYFGQEVGEKGAENPGFGSPTRTSIFDYIGVPAHQRYMNNGKFDGGQSTQQELELHRYYVELLNLSHSAPALTGEYVELDSFNRLQKVNGYDEQIFAFSRYSAEQQLIIVNNFSQQQTKQFTLHLPLSLTRNWNLPLGNIALVDLLAADAVQQQTKQSNDTLHVTHYDATVAITLAPNQSRILMLKLNQ